MQPALMSARLRPAYAYAILLGVIAVFSCVVAFAIASLVLDAPAPKPTDVKFDVRPASQVQYFSQTSVTTLRVMDVTSVATFARPFLIAPRCVVVSLEAHPFLYVTTTTELRVTGTPGDHYEFSCDVPINRPTTNFADRDLFVAPRGK